MSEENEERAALLAGGLGGTALGVVIGSLLAARPAEAATPEEKLDYLIEVLTALVPVLAEVAESQRTLIEAIRAWLGIEPGIEVIVSTPWVAKAPVEIFNRAVRETAVTLDCDRMADWTRGKRLLFKVESSLDQAVQIQLVGNIEDSMALAININAVHAVAPNGNISVGPAWDDWHPFVGARIIVGAAPTTGRLKVEFSIQE